MPKSFSRIDRIADVFQRIIVEALHRKFNDPRVGSVSVARIEVSKDLSHAKVFVTVLEEDKITITLEVLNKAAGFFRTEVAQSVRLRKIPRLRFIYDDSVAKGSRISALIDKAINPDI